MVVDHPTPVSELAWIGVVGLSAGEAHSVALSSDGEIWSWGDNRCDLSALPSPSTSL